jgi:putative transposase
MRYRRARISGGCYFITVVTHQRRELFNNEVVVELLRDAFRQVVKKYPFIIEAMVVLPDHLHSIWTLPQGDADYMTRWRLIKTYVTKAVSDKGAERLIRPTGYGKIMQPLWQHRYWEHVISSERDFRAHVDYIHYNTVRHGYVKRPGDWPLSSFELYVRCGLLASDWGASEVRFPEKVGRE